MEKLKFSPMGVHLAVKKDPIPTENEDGFAIPDGAGRTQRTGTVVALPLKDETNKHLFHYNGSISSFCNITEGDKIVFFEHAGVQYEGIYFLKLTDILARYERDSI